MTKVKIGLDSGNHESEFEGDVVIGAIRLPSGDIQAVISGVVPPEEDVKILAEMISMYYRIHGLEKSDRVMRVAQKTARRKYLEYQIDFLEKELEREVDR